MTPRVPKSLLQKLALVVPSIVVGLVLVEIVVRFFFPQILYKPRPDVWKAVPALGYRHVPNADTEVKRYGNKVHFVTDANGYRVDSRSPERGCEPKARVLMVGDSFLEGLKTEEDQTIPVLTERLLEQEYDLCVEIDNSGVSGWGPNHYYLESRQALARRRYDAGVVFFYIANDVIVAEVDSFPPLVPVPERKFRFPKRVGGGELVDAWIKPINDLLRSRSHAYILLKTRIRGQVREAENKQYFPENHKKELADSPRWEITASVCEKIQREFDRHDVPVFFVFIPVFYQVAVSYFDDHVAAAEVDPAMVDVNQPNTILRDKLTARGLTVMDPLDLMKQKAQETIDMYGGWDAHFSEEGNAFMARYIAPPLASLVE